MYGSLYRFCIEENYYRLTSGLLIDGKKNPLRMYSPPSLLPPRPLWFIPPWPLCGFLELEPIAPEAPASRRWEPRRLPSFLSWLEFLDAWDPLERSRLLRVWWPPASLPASGFGPDSAAPDGWRARSAELSLERDRWALRGLSNSLRSSLPERLVLALYGEPGERRRRDRLPCPRRLRPKKQKKEERVTQLLIATGKMNIYFMLCFSWIECGASHISVASSPQNQCLTTYCRSSLHALARCWSRRCPSLRNSRNSLPSFRFHCFRPRLPRPILCLLLLPNPVPIQEWPQGYLLHQAQRSYWPVILPCLALLGLLLLVGTSGNTLFAYHKYH